MKASNVSLVTSVTFAFALALVGCNGDDSGTSEDASSPQDVTSPEFDSTLPSEDGGPAQSADSSVDATSTNDGSQPGSEAGAETGAPTDSGTDSGGSTDSGTDGGTDLCSAIQGTSTATAVSCDGTATSFSTSGVTWAIDMSGSSASFTETVLGCALVSSGTVSCANGVFTVDFSNANTCNPLACATWGSQCTATPTAELVWTISDVTATTFLATSQNQPDGGPTPLTTCTSLGDSNPIQVTWTKQ